MPTARALAFSLAISLAACGGTQTPAGTSAPPAPLPMIDGAAVFPQPIESAGEAVQTFWNAAHEQLHDRAPVIASDLDTEGFRAAIRDQVAPWLRRRTDGLRTLATLGMPLMQRNEIATRVLVGTSFGAVVDDILAQMDGLPMPPDMPADDEVQRTYRERLQAMTADIAAIGRDAYAACARDAGGAPAVLTESIARCGTHARALDQRVATAHASELSQPAATEAQAPAVPPECEGGEWTSRSVDWNGPAPDEHAPREVAIVYDGDRFQGAERERLIAAVTARLRRVRGLRLIPRTEVRLAETLVSERRIAPDGPVCGRPWPLSALLARRHHNLVLASIDTMCTHDFVPNPPPGSAPPPETCTLSVWYSRVGTTDDTNLPDGLEHEVAEPHDGLQSWLRAAASMQVPIEAFGYGGIGALGSDHEHIEYRVLGYADDEPALRIGAVMYDTLDGHDVQDGFASCVSGHGVGSYAIRWTVSSTGAVTAASAEPMTRAAGTDPDATARCIADQLRTIAWPCTPSGQPVNVEARMCLGR